MKPSILVALLAKDLRLHGLPLLLLIGVLLAVCAGVQFAPRRGPIPGFVFNMNLIAPLLLAELLIARERAKRSFAWLRSLPVDDRTVVVGKFFYAAVVSVALWTTSSALFAPVLWSPWSTGLVLQCSLLVLGALLIAARWRTNWRYAPMVAVGVFAGPILVFLAVMGEGTARRAAVLALWNAPYGPPLAAAGLLLVYVSIVWWTVRWVERVDTCQLVD
ncbi:MAG: hypothetical protein OXC71_07640 [Chloroflexi bacterium]|nr:hypothetical protein [Chloroflexota bacterium]